MAIPGNHDISLFNVWERLIRPYARYATAFGTEIEPVHSSPEWLVVGVNTTRAWRHEKGEVSAAQIDRVAKLLRAASPNQLRVVVVHQPLAVTEARDRPNLLRGRSEALRVWALSGADLVMGGHIHLPFTLSLHGWARRLWAVQAGTAVSSRTRPGVPNSVNILRWGEMPGEPFQPPQGRYASNRRCLIEQWDYARGTQAFVRTGVTAIQPERQISRT